MSLEKNIDLYWGLVKKYLCGGGGGEGRRGGGRSVSRSREGVDHLVLSPW